MEIENLFENYEEIEIDYDSKTMIVPRGLKTIGVEGDADTRRIHYRLKKKPQDIDLSSYVWKVTYKNALGETGEQALGDIAADGDDLTMSFLIPATLCKKSGNVELALCAYDSENGKHWHIASTTHKIARYLTAERITKDDPKYDILDQILRAVYGEKITLGDLAGVEDGFSPVVVMEPDTNGFTLKITDKDGEKSHFIRDGENLHFEDLTDEQKLEIKGDPFTFEDFTDEQLQSIKGDPFTFEDFTEEQLNGLKGADGVSPTVSTSKSGRTTTVTVVDASGNHDFDILDGITPTANVSKTGDTATITIHDDESGVTTATVKDGFSPIIASSKDGLKTTISITDINGTKTAELYDATMSFDNLTEEQKRSLKGDDGLSPTIEISKSDKVTTVTIHDVSGDHTFDIHDGEDGVIGQDGKDGEDGFSPTVTASKSGSVTTLTIQNAVGDPITVLIQDGENGATFTPQMDGTVLNWSNDKELPNPDAVDLKGDPGVDGVSPTVTVSKEGLTTTLTFTGATGSTTATIEDGVYKGTVRNEMTSENEDVTLNPNETYVFPEMVTLSIQLGNSTSMYDEYHLFFKSGANATTLSLPSSVKLPDGFSIEPNMEYELSISENLALCQGWAINEESAE